MIAFRDAACITHKPLNGTVSQGREGPARFAGRRITTPVGIIRGAAFIGASKSSAKTTYPRRMKGCTFQ